MDKMKVLIVEDDEMTNHLIKQIITDLGYDVKVAFNGAEAVGLIHSYNPDVIATDVNMPEFSGLQLLNFIQKKTIKVIPTIFISSLDANMMADLVEDFGAVGYIGKPPRKEVVQTLLSKALKTTT